MRKLFAHLRTGLQCLMATALLTASAAAPAWAAVPAITSFTPTGGANVGGNVQINGTGFTGTTQIVVGGVVLNSGFTINGAGTRINTTVPSGAFSAPLSVTNSDGTGTSATKLLINATIAGFTPTIGGVGTVVTISGTSFVDVDSVRIGTTRVTSFTVVSPTEIQATVPAGASTGRIRVFTPANTAATPVGSNFTVVPAPTITSINPATGAPGASVRINGTGFNSTTSVTFNGTSAAFTITSGTRIDATVPLGATTGPITVTNPAGAANSATFTVITQPPAITGFSPTSGAPGTAVTITGQRFSGLTSVSFNGTPATFTVNGARTQIFTSVPVGAASGPISVTNALGTVTSAGSFTVLAPANTPPTLSVIGNQQACGSQTLLIDYTVGDLETPNNLTMSASALPAGVVNITADLTGTGANRQAQITAVNPAAGGSVSVTLTVTDADSSSASRTFNVVFGPALLVSAGGDQTVTANQTVTLNGSATNATSVQWSTSGTGTFANETAAQTTYSPSLADYLNGSVELTLTGEPQAGSGCTSTGSTATITFQRADLVVSGAQTISGVYNNVTVPAGAVATLGGPLDVAGTLLVQDGGTLQGAAGCPVVTGSGAFTLDAGATLRICHAAGIAATGPAGQIQVTGTRSFSMGAHYVYDGTTAQLLGSGLPATVRTLTVENPGGADMTQALSIAQELRLAGGNLRTSDLPLTLLSNAQGTAIVVNTAGVVQGAATVQRYINPAFAAGEGYRHLSAPVINTTFNDLTTGSFVPVLNPLYNSAANPLTVRPYPNIFAFDQSRAPSSADFTRGYLSPASVGSPMEWGRGYSVYMAGGTTPDFVGTLGNGPMTRTGLTKTGNFTGNTQKSGWHLLGNPYPSVIDWDLVTIPAGMSNAVSVYRSTGGNTGGYQIYVNGVGTPGTDLIGVAQGFWVRVTGTTPVNFALDNAVRVTSFANVPVYRQAADERPLLALTLHNPQTPAEQADEAIVYFEEGATAGYDAQFDGARPGRNHGIPTLATRAADEELAVNGLNPAALAAGLTLPLVVDVPAVGTYELNVRQLTNLPADVALVDALTGTRQSLTEGTTYAFRAGQAGELAGRFALVFGKGSVAGAASLSVWPNPVRELANVTLAAPAGSVQVLDALGRVVRTQTLTAGQTSTQISLQGLPAGVYSVRAGAASQRLVVE